MKQSLFRAIRRKLLEEGKLLRYLTYALGEIVLIVVGILLALKISDWNEDRKAQVEFDLYIVQLREDVRLAISVVEDRVRIADDRMRHSFSLLRHLEGDFDESLSLDALESAIIQLGGFSIADIHYGYLGQLLKGDFGLPA